LKIKKTFISLSRWKIRGEILAALLSLSHDRGLFDKNSVPFPGFLALIGRVPSQSAKNPELFVFGRSDLEIYGSDEKVPDGLETNRNSGCIDSSAIVRGIPAVRHRLSNASNRGERGFKPLARDTRMHSVLQIEDEVKGEFGAEGSLKSELGNLETGTVAGARPLRL